MRQIIGFSSTTLLTLLALTSSAFLSTARADTFGSGANSFDIQFVTIGNPGNPPDANPNPAGAVPYSYRIGKYEISEQMINKANALGGLGITLDTRGPDYPATSLTWYEAAKFVNWMNTSTGNTAAYKFDGSGNLQLWTPSDAGYDATNLYRNSLAKYLLPSLNEWHKAAYYDPVAGHYWDFPTGSDTVPDGIDFVGDPTFDAVFYEGGLNSGPNVIMDVGLLSRYGTVGQGGNAFEWEETAFDRSNTTASEHRVLLGGSWKTEYFDLAAAQTFGGSAPSLEFDSSGFRVAAIVPEPNVCALFVAAVFSVVTFKCRRPRIARKQRVRSCTLAATMCAGCN